MTIQDDVRKTLSDPTPLYAVAGTADLAIEKLREVPALVEKLREQAPDRIEALRKTDTKAAQERATERAKEAQVKLSDALGTLDTDIKKLRESAQDLALQSVGRAAEYAVKARETYDELAERGQKAVKEWRGEAADAIEVTTEVVRPEPEPEVAAKPEPKAAEEPKPAAAAAKPAAKKTSAAKKPAAKKTTTSAKATPAKKSAPSSKNES